MGMAWSLQNLGNVARAQGDQGRAAARYRESLTLFQELGGQEGMAGCLEGLAGIGWEQEDAPRAARLFGAAEAVRDRLDVPLPPSQHAAHDRSVRTLRAQLGEEAFAAAWAAGRALSLEAAIAEALAEHAPS
jgi:hypothetical protein